MGDSPELNESWKSEVASRLDRYRSHSKRKLSGDFSMRFDFDGEPALPRQQVCVPASANPEPESESPEEVPQLAVESATEAELLTEQKEIVVQQESGHVELPQALPPTQPPPSRPSIPFKRKIRMEANVIEFPRLFPPEPPLAGTLAEPVMPTTPRILDAPEIAEPLLENPILEGMRLEKLDNDPVPAFELPLQVAPLVQRAYASAADLALVAVASTLFTVVAYKLLPSFEWSKSMIGTIAVVPVILWAFYQYLFVVYGARTPGMAIAQIALSTFTGTAPNHRQRRRRVLATFLSASSLTLGFVWSFFDEDTLCWHDRISRTYSYHQKP